MSNFKHKLFADKKNPIHGIENFCNQAKRHLRKFNGVSKANFYLSMNERDWQFNFGSLDKLLKILVGCLKLNDKQSLNYAKNIETLSDFTQ